LTTYLQPNPALHRVLLDIHIRDTLLFLYSMLGTTEERMGGQRTASGEMEKREQRIENRRWVNR
jgi:hypothetical protein